MNKDNMKSSNQVHWKYAESDFPKPRQLTKQGRVILDAILSATNLMNPSEIHAKIWDSKAIKRIALVTVYRTLNFLVYEGLIRKVVLPSGEFLYEARNMTNQFGYCLCRKCGRMFQLDSNLSVLPMVGGVPGGFKVEFQECFFFGICRSCSELEV